MTFEDIYKPGIFIICRNKEDSDSFRMFLSKYGVKWGSGQDPAVEDNWGLNDKNYIIYNFIFYDKELRVYYGHSPGYLENSHCNLIEYDEIKCLNTLERECDSSLIIEFYK